MSTDYQEALQLRGTVKSLQVRAKRLRNANPSMEQAKALLELVGAYAGVGVDSTAVSLESITTPDEVLDKVEHNLGQMTATLEWFFSKTKETKTNKSSAAPAVKLTDEEMFTHLDKKYSNKAWLKNATMHVKPTILSGTAGGILSFNGSGLSVDETIKKLTEETKNIGTFHNQARTVFAKWVKWANGLTEAIEVEWEKHKDEDEIPSITEIVRKLHAQQPAIPTDKFILDKIIVLGTIKNFQWFDKHSGSLPGDLPIPEAQVEFESLTHDQVFKLADLAMQLYGRYEQLYQLEDELLDSSPTVGFDDYPYRADAVRDAIDDFGWNKANWDAHNLFNQFQLITLLGDCSYRKFKAIHSWLYNAVVERP